MNSDLTPNDLSHLSDAEFHALCPQGEHAPGPEPLSPAARAAVTAFDERYERLGPFESNWQEVCLAAALEALADHVTPLLGHSPEDAREDERLCVRDEVFAIINELEIVGDD